MAIKISDAQLFLESTADTAQSEPIFEDNINSGVYWKLYVDDGQLAIEPTGTVQDDQIILYDETYGLRYILLVNDGQFGFNEFIVIPPFKVVKINKNTKTIISRR